MTRTRDSRRRSGCTAAWLVALTLLAGLAAVPAGTDVRSGADLRLAALPGDTTNSITIGTVPPVAGFPVILDGVTHLTDAEGRVHVATTPGGLVDRITLNEAIVPIGGRDVKVSASRVYYRASTGEAARLALDLNYLVRFHFANMHSAPVDASVIETITVKSITGQVLELPAHEDSWLQGSRVVPLMGSLEVKQLQWTVQRVEYSGSNVVNASQQRFLPAEQEDVDVKLLFYKVVVSVRDAFFGFSHSGTVELVYPDGRSRRFSLDDDGRLTLPTLPRGNYTLTTIGPGPDLSRPLALSRNQDLDLNFYSWVDIAAIGAVVLALAVGLPFLGWRRRRKHRARSAPAPAPAPAEEDSGPGPHAPTQVPEAAAMADPAST